MNQKETIGAVHNSMYHQIQNRGFAAAVDVLMDLEILSKSDYESWRNGKVSYLEKVCHANLKQLGFILKQMQIYGKKAGLKESWTFYGQWGRKHKNTVKLRFSKTGSEYIEKQYATHFVEKKDI